jgi:hypothetical protein
MSNNYYDEMEIGDSGWVPTKNGGYKNIYNNHTIDSVGREFDSKGNLIYDPEGESNDIN